MTKNKIESYDGVPLRTAIKDSIIIKQVLDAYGEEIRIDTVKDKSIYMGHFTVQKNDLQEKPFIDNSEILGVNFENSEIYFAKSAAEKISKSKPKWLKESHFGKQFVLCHNGKIILTGYFINSWSSYWSTTYQIYYHSLPEKRIADSLKNVHFTFSNSINFEKNNLKKNTDLYNAFRNRIIN